MFGNSLVSENIIYKFFWQFFAHILCYFSLFSLYFLLISISSDINLYDIFIALLIGLSLKALLEFQEVEYINFIGHVVPFLTTYLWIVIFDNTNIEFISNFLFIFGTYSVIMGISQEILRLVRPLWGGIIFGLIQINKLFFMLIIAYITLSNLENTIYLQFQFIQFEETYSIAIVYIFLNILLFSISFFGLMLLLMIRNIQLLGIASQLEKISNWSFDKKVLNKELINNEVMLKHRTRIVLFGDIRGFTSFSEKNDIKEAVKILERFYYLIETIIKKYGGHKPEFIADEFITFFDNVETAIKCSFELREKVNKYLETVNLSMGMGIDIGRVLEGIVGGGMSKKYTVLGRAVNTASRLQSNAKGRQILVSQKVIDHLPNLQYEEIEGIILKGISPDFKIYSVNSFNKHRKRELNFKAKMKRNLKALTNWGI